MTRKVYRTAQGKMVDLGRLQLQNEDTRAVGNMGVNARGDVIDSHNRPITRRTNQVQKQYNKQTEQAPTPPVRKVKPKAAPAPVIPAPPEDFQDDFSKEEQPIPASGLATAIAKARSIKQEPLRTSADTAEHQAGMRKL